MSERPIVLTALQVSSVLRGEDSLVVRATKQNQRIQTGDELWVQERWDYADWDPDGFPAIRYAVQPHRYGVQVLQVQVIPADWADRVRQAWESPPPWPWHPASKMPPWAARIWLRVLGVERDGLNWLRLDVRRFG